MAINSRTTHPCTQDAGAFDVGAAATATGVGTVATIGLLTAPVTTLVVACGVGAVVAAVVAVPSVDDFIPEEEDLDDYVAGSACWEMEHGYPDY